MNTKANVQAIRERIGGQAATRRRAAAMASAAGIGVGAAVYRFLRGPDQ